MRMKFNTALFGIVLPEVFSACTSYVSEMSAPGKKSALSPAALAFAKKNVKTSSKGMRLF